MLICIPKHIKLIKLMCSPAEGREKFSTILKTFTPQFLLSIMFHNNVQLLQNWFILINPYQLNPSVGINLNVNLHFMLLPLKSNLTVNLHNKHSLFVLALRMLCCNVIHMTYYDDDNARRAQFFFILTYVHTEIFILLLLLFLFLKAEIHIHYYGDKCFHSRKASFLIFLTWKLFFYFSMA